MTSGRDRHRPGSDTDRVAVSEPAPVRRKAGREIPPLRGLLPLAAGLTLWQLLQHGQSAYYPRPSLWVKAIQGLWDQGALWQGLVATVETFAIALGLAAVLGTLIGALVGRSRLVARMFGPSFEFCRVMPAAAVVPLAVLAAGYTENMKLSVVVFAAIWPVLLQVQAAAHALEETRLDVGRTLRLTRVQVARKILLPSLLPAILLGIRLAAPIVLIIVLLVEIITHVTGLGALIADAQTSFHSAAVYGLVAITGILGLLVNVLVSLLEGLATRYRPE